MEKDCAKKYQLNVHGFGKEKVAIDFSVRFHKCNFYLVPPSFSFLWGSRVIGIHKTLQFKISFVWFLYVFLKLVVLYVV